MKFYLLFSVSMVAIFSASAIGCASQPTPYSIVKTGPDRYTLGGVNPNVMQANAYTVCKNDGFADYTVVAAGHDSMNIQCEKAKKNWSDTASEAYESVKKKIQNLSNGSKDTK